MNKESLWRQTIEFYKDLLENNWDVKLQLELVKEIAKTDYSKSFYPSTSHDVLCLSTRSSYSESQDFPMVTIQNLGDRSFRIQFWSKPTKTHDLIIYKCDYSEVWKLLEALFLRLKLEIGEVNQ